MDSNRIRDLFGPSCGETLLQHAYAFKIEGIRFGDEGDEELSVCYEVKGTLPPDADAGELLAGLIAALQPREGGAAHA